MEYDQVNLPNLAAAEALCREIQVQEERYADRVASRTEWGEERSIFSGQETHGNLCICPELKKWAGQILSERNLINKERRKAREERGLARPPKKSG